MYFWMNLGLSIECYDNQIFMKMWFSKTILINSGQYKMLTIYTIIFVLCFVLYSVIAMNFDIWLRKTIYISDS